MARSHRGSSHSYTPQGGTEKSPGGMFHKRLVIGAHSVATQYVMKQESAEAIVDAGRRQR